MASAAPPSATPASPPRQVAPAVNPASPPSKRDLKSWWKGFKIPSRHQDLPATRGIFGVPLRQSITYANVAISLIDEQGQSYIYGYVPIVVAKCGVFLKEKATSVEGIFRLNGSEKRIKELKTAFDSPDRYGKGLVWEGYTVHDASNVLRRYLNDLPEPVVPLDLYEKFRDPLRGATKQAVGDGEGLQYVEEFQEISAIERYQQLITELPPLNKQLLLYILDLLAVFAAKAEENRMNSQNLSAIFQPGMLSHPQHAMAPEEYRLNQCVIIFLIENQDHFLIGMQGTAADEKTVKEVESGTPVAPLTPNPVYNTGVTVVRSSSNASAGADSVRREGQIRRNRSVNSRHSRQDSTPNSPALAATPTGGLGRSNTVPSKRSPAIAGGKFKKLENPGNSPSGLAPLTQAQPLETQQIPSEQSSLVPPIGGGGLSPGPASAAGRSQEKLLGVPEATTPTKERNLQSFFQRSPAIEDNKRQPNKLKKKRLPGSMNPSAHSSNASLPRPPGGVSPGVEISNPMEQYQPEVAENMSSQAQVQAVTSHPTTEARTEAVSDLAPRAINTAPSSTLHPEANSTLKPKSPPASVHSSFNDGSDPGDRQSGDNLTAAITGASDSTEKERKRRWGLGRGRKDGHESPRLMSPDRGFGAQGGHSTTSISSGGHKPRKSFTGETAEFTTTVTGGVESHHDREDGKGPLGWIRNKYRERKENSDHKRTKSPSSDDKSHGGSNRGKSLDIRRESREEEKRPVTSTPMPLPTQVAPQPSTSGPAELPASNTQLQSPPAAATVVSVSQAPNQEQALTSHPVISEELTMPASSLGAVPEQEVPETSVASTPTVVAVPQTDHATSNGPQETQQTTSEVVETIKVPAKELNASGSIHKSEPELETAIH